MALHLVGRQADALEESGDAVASISLPPAMPWTTSGSATRSPTVMRGSSEA